jgi:hypothetical protein
VVPHAGLRVAARRLALAAVAVAILAWSLGCGGAAHGSGTVASDAASTRASGASVSVSASTAAPAPVPVPVSPPRQRVFSVGLRVLHFVDRSRTLPGGEPRTLTTYVRYPAQGQADGHDHLDATPAQGPFPLVVFGHGFAVTPTIYAPLMRYWTRAGFVVAAPVFPLGNANAPGGPYEPDLVHQPADMSYVISSLLTGGGSLAGLVDPARIAVAGQSDGGDTALAVAYDRRYRDPRVRAAVILSGAEIPYTGSFNFPTAGDARHRRHDQPARTHGNVLRGRAQTQVPAVADGGGTPAALHGRTAGPGDRGAREHGVLGTLPGPAPPAAGEPAADVCGCARAGADDAAGLSLRQLLHKRQHGPEQIPQFLHTPDDLVGFEHEP